jgi:hypothetical protein
MQIPEMQGSGRSVRFAAATIVALTLFGFAQLAAAAPHSGSSAQRAQRGSAIASHSSFQKVLRLARRFQSRKGRRPAPKRPPAASTPVVPAPPSAPPTPNDYRDRVGFSTHVVWMEDDEQLAYLRKLREGGVIWMREDFSWGALERSKGVWNWTIGDQLMRNVAKVGMNVVGVLGYSAGWASSGPTIKHPPRDNAEYANYARTVVERYGAGGTFWALHPELTPRPLQAVELWNEPWHHHFWRPNPDPAAYARLVRAAAAAIKSTHPEMRVLANADIFQMREDTPASVDWARLLFDADPALFRDLVDGYTVHLYSEERGPHDRSVDARWRFDRLLMTRAIARSHGADKPIWVTEFGWNTHPSTKEVVSEATQARFIREAFGRLVGEWGSFVPASFLYHWGKPSDDWDGGFTMIRPDGSMKPAWQSITDLVR